MGHRAHIEKARGTDTDNIDYCSKQDKQAFIFGQPIDGTMENGGGSNRLEEAVAWAHYLAQRDRKEHAKCDPSVADPQTLMDIAMSYDGSWLTRGHTSLIGVGFVIEVLTGLVLDAYVKSSHCQVCLIKETLQKEDAHKFAVRSNNILDQVYATEISSGLLA
ncbi:hypothetical protein RRG08_062853 [Elysia crispata]|uniref:CRESS-DNA virus Rep endonuclease domain-containing protein n=1 Tax=Elysia crispata TaxID=231223 RepID=A0AAE0Z9E6_9GAST|nr:hypothetical protein RRG08_062853 [Elysia crispata]